MDMLKVVFWLTRVLQLRALFGSFGLVLSGLVMGNSSFCSYRVSVGNSLFTLSDPLLVIELVWGDVLLIEDLLRRERLLEEDRDDPDTLLECSVFSWLRLVRHYIEIRWENRCRRHRLDAHSWNHRHQYTWLWIRIKDGQSRCCRSWPWRPEFAGSWTAVSGSHFLSNLSKLLQRFLGNIVKKYFNKQK